MNYTSNSKMLGGLCLAAMAMVSGHAFAYSETLMESNGRGGWDIIGTTQATHFGDPYSYVTDAVSITSESGPVPRLTFSSNGNLTQQAGGGWTQGSPIYAVTLAYDYTIHAAANTAVPIGFSGLVNFRSTGAQQFNTLSSTFHVGSSSTDTFAHGVFSVSNAGIGAGINYTPKSGTAASVPWTFEGTSSTFASGTFPFEFMRAPGHGSLFATSAADSDNWLRGKFSGVLDVKTDEFGDAKARVTLSIVGSAALSSVIDNQIVAGSLYGMIDPYLYILPSYLAADPTASLAVESGVGNVAAVPEPETYAMLLAGLGLLGSMARRRKQA